MGKELFGNFSVARETFEEAADATHLDLKKLCFDGPESDLTLTEHTQPCLLTTSVAAFRVAQRELGFAPGAPAGHGTMAAILGMEDTAVGKLCTTATESAKAKRASLEEDAAGTAVDCIVQPANFNSPGQVVIAGSVDAVNEAIALVKAGGDYAGGKAMPLSVSAPFHCGLMRPARDRMAELFALGQKPGKLACPYVPNRTGRLTQESGVIYELLVEQVDHPVLWKQSVAALLEAGFVQAVEFGPGKILSGLLKRIATPLDKPWAATNVGDASGLKLLEGILK
jgi:[acyl-carrier-protein] S-malonyltransferase